MKTIVRLFGVIVALFFMYELTSSCAQRGRPSGGPKDTIPPKFVNSVPPNYTTDFKAKTIRINFNEFITLDEPNKQILISPPMEKKPIISPQGQPSKYVEIEFMDTLRPETTYTINFGRSIVDNNESNPLPFFKYAFSTGGYIDSLELSGRVTDAFKRETDPYISVMLYKLDTTYTDSTVYKTPPSYIAYTKDSTNTFTLENLKEGAYKIVALRDKNQDYMFNPNREKIGFTEDTVHLPTDERYNLTIFKEIRDYKAVRPEQVSARHLLFGFEGLTDSVDIRLLSDKPTNYEAAYYRQTEHDSIDYWFKPKLEIDSLKFEIRNQQQRDTLLAVLKEADRDSLKISAEPQSVLPLADNFELSANTPLERIDTSYISILNKDSVQIPFRTTFKSRGNKLIFDFKTKEKETYYIEALPGALEDFYGEKNDTLHYRLNTKASTEYADISLTLQNIAQYPVIVQLVNKQGETQREIIHHKNDRNIFKFEHVEAGNYYVKVIYDENDNGKWDPGNYLKKQQPEKVIYMKKPLDVRKNWEISQTFILKG